MSSDLTSFFNIDVFSESSVSFVWCIKLDKPVTDLRIFKLNTNYVIRFYKCFNIDVFSESSVSFVWCIRLDKPVSVLMAFKLNTNYVIRFYKFFNIDVFSESSVRFVWCIRLDKPISGLMVFKLNTNSVIRFYKCSGKKLLLNCPSKDVFWYMKIAGKHSVVHGCLLTYCLKKELSQL